MGWRQAGKRTNNNLTSETRTHSSEGSEKKYNTHERKGGEKEEFFLVISRNEPTVIWQWQSDEMCEFGKRRFQDKGTNPESTSETTANSDRALIIS